MKVLVTGFAPFGGETMNPSYEAVKAMPERIDGAPIIKLQVPVEFEGAEAVLESALRLHQPDIVLCVGQAGGHAGIAVERVAINLRDASMPDQAGKQPVDEPVRADGTAAYFSSLPGKAIVTALQAAGIPAFVSNTAGTYVCNDLMYTLLYWIDRHGLRMRGGFIHVPYAMEQAAYKPQGTPSMALPEIARGLELAVKTVLAQPWLGAM